MFNFKTLCSSGALLLCFGTSQGMYISSSSEDARSNDLSVSDSSDDSSDYAVDFSKKARTRIFVNCNITDSDDSDDNSDYAVDFSKTIFNNTNTHCRTCDTEILDVIGISGFSYIQEYDYFPNLKTLKVDAKNLGYFVAKLTDVFFDEVPVEMRDVSGWSTDTIIFDIFPSLEELCITERIRWSTIVRILRYFPTLKSITLSGLDLNEEQHDDAEIKYLDILTQETEKEQKESMLRRLQVLAFNIPQFLKYGATIKQNGNTIKNVVDIYKDKLTHTDSDTNDTDSNVSESDINGSIEYDGDPNTQNDQSKTHLMIELQSGDTEKAKSLINSSTKDALNLQDRKGKTALLYTIISDKISEKDKTEIVKLLIKNGAIPNQEALFFARNLCYDEITDMLDQNRPFSDCDEFKISDLDGGVMLQGNLKKIEYYDQEIFQHFGIDENRIKKMNLFDYQKEMLDLKDLNNLMSEVKDYTEIERYISGEGTEKQKLKKIVPLLKEKLKSLSEDEFKAWLNDKNYEGDTALHFAAKYGYANIAKLIILGGANADIKNKDAITPSEYAEQYHGTNVANLFKNPSETGSELLKNEFRKMEDEEKKIREESDDSDSESSSDDRESHYDSDSGSSSDGTR